MSKPSECLPIPPDNFDETALRDMRPNFNRTLVIHVFGGGMIPVLNYQMLPMQGRHHILTRGKDAVLHLTTEDKDSISAVRSPARKTPAISASAGTSRSACAIPLAPPPPSTAYWRHGKQVKPSGRNVRVYRVAHNFSLEANRAFRPVGSVSRDGIGSA